MLLRGSATSTCDAAGVPAGFCEEGLPLFGSPIPEHGAEVTSVKHIFTLHIEKHIQCTFTLNIEHGAEVTSVIHIFTFVDM